MKWNDRKKGIGHSRRVKTMSRIGLASGRLGVAVRCAQGPVVLVVNLGVLVAFRFQVN
jgi:hypothetical protein